MPDPLPDPLLDEFRAYLALHCCACQEIRSLACNQIKSCLPLSAREALSGSEAYFCRRGREPIKFVLLSPIPATIAHADRWTDLETLATVVRDITGVTRLHIRGFDLAIAVWHDAASNRWIRESLGVM